jgi:uncharacterized protein (DUF1330 family)
MPKGYWIAHAEVEDADAWKRYVATARPAFEAHGARFLARGGATEDLEETTGRSRHVVIEFPSYEAAKACWNAPEYQAGRAEREGAGRVSITIVEGVE